MKTQTHTLSERKAEREREHSRHAASLRQLEHSLNSRERMYKERILGLEEQVRQTIEDDQGLVRCKYILFPGEPAERATVKRGSKSKKLYLVKSNNQR